MPDDPVVMTAADLAALEGEIARLETEGRREIAARIKTAREWGDLKENAEYHDAKNDQARLETRILQLREVQLHAEIRESVTGAATVGLGSTVTVVDAENARERTYTIVSSVDADAGAGKLSIDSPVGRALVGKAQGEVATVETPRGTRELEITALA